MAKNKGERKTKKQRMAEAENRPKKVYVRTKHFEDFEAQIMKQKEEEEKRKEAEAMMKQAELEEQQMREHKEKMKKMQDEVKDEESGLTYRQIVCEAIAARESEEDPWVSMNAILKYFADYFTNGIEKRYKKLVQNAAKSMAKDGILKQKRDSFCFQKKHLDMKPEMVPIRDLIQHAPAETPAKETTTDEAPKETSPENK